MAGFWKLSRDYRYYGAMDVVDGFAKVLAALVPGPLLLETAMATPVMIAAAPTPIMMVPLPISWAGLTPAGRPGARSAAKAEEPTIAATVTAATTFFRLNIGFPRFF